MASPIPIPLSPLGDFSFSERGGSLGPPSPADPSAVPTGATFAVPHIASFASQYNTNTRAYSGRFDEAILANRENAERMRLDTLIAGCLEARAEPVSLLTWTFAPEDPDDQRQVEAAKRQERLLRRLPRFVEAHRWLLVEGLFVGRAGLRTRWESTGVDPLTGRSMIFPTEAVPIAGDKLGFKWSGELGIAVSASFANPRVEFLDTYPFYFLTREERESVIVHRQFSEDANFYKPWFGGAIHGTGLRGKLYWLWALKAQLWQLTLDQLTWWAKGLTAYYVEHGNQAHADAIADYINKQNGSSSILYPVFRDPTTNTPYFQKPIERFEAGLSGPSFMQELITKYIDDQIRFLILHQQLTVNTANTGLGSGVAAAHMNTNENRVKLDATMLQETYTLDLVRPMYRSNEPGIPPGRFVFTIDSPNVQQILDASEAIVGMGGSVPLAPLLEAAGIPEAKPNDTLLSNVQPSSPTAVGTVPAGDPMLGQGGSQPLQRVRLGRLVGEHTWHHEMETPVGPYTMHAHRVGRQSPTSPWEMSFTAKGAHAEDPYALTGHLGAKAIHVIRAVGTGLDEFLHSVKPHTVTVSAALREPSRVKLYRKMMPLLAKKHGYRHEETLGDDADTVHTLYRG